MESFYIALMAAGAALIITMRIIKSKTGLNIVTDNQQQSSVLDEMNLLLETVDTCSATEQERQTRYHDIKDKYKDTLAVLGYDFPEFRKKSLS